MARAEREARVRVERAEAKADDTEANRKKLRDAARDSKTDAVRGYIAKGVNVNCQDVKVSCTESCAHT